MKERSSGSSDSQVALCRWQLTSFEIHIIISTMHSFGGDNMIELQVISSCFLYSLFWRTPGLKCRMGTQNGQMPRRFFDVPTTHVTCEVTGLAVLPTLLYQLQNLVHRPRLGDLYVHRNWDHQQFDNYVCQIRII